MCKNRKENCWKNFSNLRKISFDHLFFLNGNASCEFKLNKFYSVIHRVCNKDLERFLRKLNEFLKFEFKVAQIILFRKHLYDF